jgi:hypothetical protein
MSLGSYTGPFGRRQAFYTLAGVGIPPTLDTSLNYGPDLGTTITLNGVGIIRAFGYNTSGKPWIQEQYNCIYDTTPSI